MNAIENDKQYEITQRWLKDFKEALEEMSLKKGSMDKLLYELHTNASKSIISDLEEQIRVWEKHKIEIKEKYGSLEGCPFHYCDTDIKCVGKCKYT